MASYQKYIMMGVSTLLIPLVKRIIQELVGKYAGEARDDSADEESETLDPVSILSGKRAG